LLTIAYSVTFMADGASGQNFARGIRPEEGSAKSVLGPGDALIPQVATGTVPGGAFFFTQFEGINVTDAPASLTIYFGDDEGNDLALPIINPDGTPLGETTGVVWDVIPPGADGGAFTNPNSDVRVGYAIAVSDPPGSVAVMGIFNNQVPGSRLFRASMAPDIIVHNRVRTIFNGGPGGFVSSLAVVSAFAQTLTVTARNGASGDMLCSAPLFLPVAGHRAFIIREQLPCANGVNGILEVTAPLGGIGAVGFAAADQGQGAFTTLPVFGN
jgi:hypothetical protein